MFDFTSDTGLHIVSFAQELLMQQTTTPLRVAEALRKAFPGTDSVLLSEAQTLASNRIKASFLGSWTKDALFTDTMLQQCSHPKLSRIHAAEFPKDSCVVEVCTGAGIDTAALAAVVPSVTTFDIDERVVQYTRHNLQVRGISNVDVICADAATEDLPPANIWSDPSRRSQDKRVVDPESYAPPLSFIEHASGAHMAGVKVSPATHIPTAWVGEYTGVGWQCQELVLWRNCNKPRVACVVVDPSNGKVVRWIPPDLGPEKITEVPASQLLGARMIEPHPAVLRTGTLAHAFAANHLVGVDTTIALGFSESANEQVRFPHREYVVQDIVSADFKSVNKLIRHYHLDSGTQIKKRGFHLEPTVIRRKLKFVKSGTAGILMFTRNRERRICMLLQRKNKGMEL